MSAILKVGTILCWAVAIGSEYVIQVWPKRKKVLNILAMTCFALALIGEYAAYRSDAAKEADLETAINAQGVSAVEWFDASDTNEETFAVGREPIAGSVEVLINGVIEPEDVYLVRGKSVTVTAKLNGTDRVIIKYRHPR